MHNKTSDRVFDIRNRAGALLEAMAGQFDDPPVRRELNLRFSVKQVADMVGRAPNTIRKAELAGDIPASPRRESGHREGYTLEEVNAIREHFGSKPSRGADDDPCIIAVQNFKGGVGKSTLSVHLAQFLAMKGYSVLFIDADPQASSTTMFGFDPEELDPNTDTLLPIFRMEDHDQDKLVVPTHWDGLDMIRSCLGLYNAEYVVAGGRTSSPQDRLERLRRAIHPMAHCYDVVVCDPPPALGMISLSVIRAMNALVIPTPPSKLDYHSTVSFLSMLGESLQVLENFDHHTDFKFIHLLATKMSEAKSAHLGIRDAMENVFGGDLLQTAMVDSAEYENASVDGRTVFEFTGRQTSTYRRCRRNLEQVLGDIEVAIRKTWPSHQRSVHYGQV